MEKTVCELFAGVGGFRLGLERSNKDWKTVWFSQWEPGASHQWAHECYVSHWGDIDENTGKDIACVDKKLIPDHNLLVGGFPCQDYSVARPLSGSKGINGKKGVLWWQIFEVLQVKKPSFCLFENVDRLLKSPSSQHGRDFGVMLACLNKLGYMVEWRVVNAAEYGAAQRRRRVFIFAYKKSTSYYKKNSKLNVNKLIIKDGFFASVFPVKQDEYKISETELVSKDIHVISDNFEFTFENSGFMRNGKIYTAKSNPIIETPINLGDILVKKADKKYYISKDKISKWEYLKGSKKIERTSRTGHKYIYSEGAIAYPDYIDRPARTMLTSEGTVNRSSHIVKDPQTGKMRIITPVEAERIQGFGDDWTSNMPDRNRYFCMGNALVVPMIERMGNHISEIIDSE